MAQRPLERTGREETSISKVFLDREFRKSVDTLAHLANSTERVLERVAGGRTDQGRAFITVWNGLQRDLQEILDDIDEDITTNRELQRICHSVRIVVSSFLKEFDLKKSGSSPTKRLVRGVRNELRRVQKLISERFLLAEEDEDETLDESEVRNGDEGEETEEEKIVGMMIFPSDIDYSILYFNSQLEAIIFDLLKVFLDRLEEEELWNSEEESLTEESFNILQYFISVLKRFLDELTSMIEAKFKSGGNFDFEEFKVVLLKEIQERKPSKNKGHYCGGPRENPYSRLVEEYFGRFLERISGIESAEEFYDPSLDKGTKAVESRGFLAENQLLYKKSGFIKKRDELDGGRNEERREFYPITSEEKAIIREEWYKVRTNESDYLNNSTRKSIAKELNSRFHGGLSLRTAADVKYFITQIAEEDRVNAGRDEAERAKLEAWHVRLFDYVRTDYIQRVSAKFIELVRHRLETAQRVDSGGVIVLDAVAYTRLQQALQKIAQRVDENFVFFRDTYAKNLGRMRDLFGGKDKKFLTESFNTAVDGIVVDRNLFLTEEDRSEFKTINIDSDFVLTRLGTHETADVGSVQIPDFDLNVMLKRGVLGALSDFDENGYDGAIMPDEERFLRSSCELSIAGGEITIDAFMADSRDSGMLAQWTSEMNNLLYSGFRIRRDGVVENFVRNIVMSISLEKRRATESTRAQITPELQARIDAVVTWVRSLTGDTRSFFRKLLSVLAEKKLHSDIVANMPAFVTEAYVSKLELCKERTSVSGDGIVRVNMDEAEIAVLMDLALPERENYQIFEKLHIRIADIDREIINLRERIEQRRLRGEDLDGKKVHVTSLRGQLNEYNGQIFDIDQRIADKYVELGEIYKDAGAIGATLDNVAIARIQSNIERMNNERQAIVNEKQLAQDLLHESERTVIQMELEMQGLSRLDEQLTAQLSLKARILDELEVIYDQSFKK